MKRGLFYLLKSWLSSDTMRNTIVGSEANNDPSESGIRRVNRKNLMKVLDLEVEEYLMIISTVGVQRKAKELRVLL